MVRPKLRGQSQSGVALLQALVVGGVLMMVGYALYTSITHRLAATKSSSLREELEMLKLTVSTRLDCRNTLRLAPLAGLPVNCNSYRGSNYNSTWSLRRRGSPNNGGLDIAPGGNLGAWSISAKCTNNHVVVRAKRSGKDPLTGLLFNTMATASDLFEGKSDFCREFFQPGGSCGGAYTVYHGSDHKGPICCREERVSPPPPNYGDFAEIVCQPNEYLVAGGGSGHSDYIPGSPVDSDVFPPLFDTAFPYQGFKWAKFGVNTQRDANTVTPTGTDTPSIAAALCCPN